MTIRDFRLFLLAALAVNLGGAAQRCVLAPAGPFTVAGSAYTVSAEHRGRTPDGNYGFQLTVSDNNREVTRLVDLTTRAACLQGLRLARPDLLVVLGLLGGGGDILTLFDLSSSKVLDIMWGWDAEFSHRGNLIAYDYRYPPGGLPVYRTSILLIYDLSRTPMDNSAHPEHLGDPETRGFIIHPARNRLRQRYFIPAEDESEKFWFNSPFAWSGDDQKIAFLQHHQDRNSLVIVDISKGLKNPEIQELDMDRHMPTFYDEQERRSFKAPFLLPGKVRFGEGDSEVVVTPYRGGPSADKSVTIDLKTGERVDRP